MEEQKQEEGENQRQEEEEEKPNSELEEKDSLIGVKSIEDSNVTAQTSKIADQLEENCPNDSNDTEVKEEIEQVEGEMPSSTFNDGNEMKTEGLLCSENNEENPISPEENKLTSESFVRNDSKQELLLVPASDNKTELPIVNAQTSPFIRKQLFFIKKIIPTEPGAFPLKSLPKDSVPCTVPLKTLKKDTITCMLPLKTLSKESVPHAVTTAKTVLKDPKARPFRLKTFSKDSVVCAVLPDVPSKDLTPIGVSSKNPLSDSTDSGTSPKKSLKDSVASATLPKTLSKDSVQSSVPPKSTPKGSGSLKREDQGEIGSGVKRKFEKSMNNGVAVSHDSSNLAALVEPLIKRRRTLKTDGSLQDVDKYCWTCHRDGIVIPCATCPRVYHLRCVQLEDSPSGDWVCPECITILNAENVETRSRAMRQLSLDQLCNLLKYALHRMKAYPGSEPFWKPVDQTLFPRYREFVAHPMDLSQLERNIRRKMYGSTEAFIADTKWILHDCIIFNTHHTKLSSTAKSILKICKQEMSEIEICPDCYLNAHTRKDSWFIEVCRKPHVLLWAKLKGFPFWPAKVMRTNRDNMVDVRFFGAHDRAWVPVRDCFLYSISIPTIARNKKKHNLEACVSEVEQHIQKLKERFGAFEYAAFRIPFDPSKEEEHLAMFLPGYKGESSVSHLPFQQRFRPRILRKSSEKPPPVDAQARLGGFRVSTVHSEAAGLNQSKEEEADEEVLVSAGEEPEKEEEQPSCSASSSPVGRGRPLRVYSRRRRSPSPSTVQEIFPKSEPEEEEEIVVKTEPEEPEPPKIGSTSLSDWARFEMEAARITMSQQCSNASDMDADELISEELVTSESCNVGLVDIVHIKEEPLPEPSPPQSPEYSENLASEDTEVKETPLCDKDPTDVLAELKSEPVDKSNFSSQSPCEFVKDLPTNEETKNEGSSAEKVDRPVSGESDMESLNITEDDTSSLSSASETAEREIWARMAEVHDESKEASEIKEKTCSSDSVAVNEPDSIAVSEENNKPLPEQEISDTTSRKRPREVDDEDDEDEVNKPVHVAAKECKLSSEETHQSVSSSSVTTPTNVEQNSAIIEKLEDAPFTPNKKVGLLPALIRRLHGSQPRVYLSRTSGGRSMKAPATGSSDLDDKDNECVNAGGVDNENVSTSTNYTNVCSPAGGDSNSRSSLSSTSSSESRGSNTSNSSSSTSSSSSSNSCSTKSSTSSSVSSSSSSSTSSSGSVPNVSKASPTIEKKLEMKESILPESLMKPDSEVEKIIDDKADSVPDKIIEEETKNDNSLTLAVTQEEISKNNDHNEVSEKTDTSEDISKNNDHSEVSEKADSSEVKQKAENIGAKKEDEVLKETTDSSSNEDICNKDQKEDNVRDHCEDKTKQENESESLAIEVTEENIEKNVDNNVEDKSEKGCELQSRNVDVEKTNENVPQNVNNTEVCTKDSTDSTDAVMQKEIKTSDESGQGVEQDIEESRREVIIKETEETENETIESQKEIEGNANSEERNENEKDEFKEKMTVDSATENKILENTVGSTDEAGDKCEQEEIGSKDEENSKTAEEEVKSKDSERTTFGDEIDRREPEKITSVEKEGEVEEREEREVMYKNDEMQNTEQEKDICIKPPVKKKGSRKREERERKKEKDSQMIDASFKNKPKEIEVPSKSEIKDSNKVLDKKSVPPAEEISLKDLSLLTCIKQEPMDVEEELSAAEEDEDGSLLSSIRTGSIQTRRSELVTTSEDRDHSSPNTLNDKDSVLPSYLYPSVTITVDNDKHVETNGPSEPLRESSTSQMASPQADGTINIEEVKASVGLPRAISLSVIAGNSNTKESSASGAVGVSESSSPHDTSERCGAPTIITTPMGYTVTAHNGLEISTHPAPQSSLSTHQAESTVPTTTSQGRARKSFPNRPHPQVKITQSVSGGPSGKNVMSSSRRGSSDSRRGSFSSLSNNLSQIQGGDDSNSGASSIRNSDGPMVYIPSASARFSGLANGPSALINGDLGGAVHRLGSSHSGGAHHQGMALAGGSLLPHLQPRPSPQQAAGLLTGKCNSAVPPEAGPVSEDISKHAQKLAGYMQQTIEDVLRDMSNSGNLEASTKMLQLELEKVHWRYQQEIAELKHNTDLLLVEMRASMMSEQQRAVADAVRQCEIDKQRAIEDTKKKQWCTSCGKEALFYCCWNTSYCDYPCQQRHWPQHMASCGQAESMKAREAAENGLPAGAGPAAALVHHAAKGYQPGSQPWPDPVPNSNPWSSPSPRGMGGGEMDGDAAEASRSPSPARNDAAGSGERRSWATSEAAAAGEAADAAAAAAAARKAVLKRKRCGRCAGCSRSNCGRCPPCLNSRTHQVCRERRCSDLQPVEVVPVASLKKSSSLLSMSSGGPPSSKGMSLPGVQTHRPRGPAPPYSLMPMPRPPMQVVGRVQPASSTTTGIAASSNITTTTSTSATTSCVAFVHTPVNSGSSPVILCHVSGRSAPPGGASVVATTTGISRTSAGVPSSGSAAGGGGGGGSARATGKSTGGGGPSHGSSSSSSASYRALRTTASSGGGSTPTSSSASTPTAALLHLRPVVATGPVVRLP